MAGHDHTAAGEDLHQSMGRQHPLDGAQLPMSGCLSEGQTMTDDERFKRWGEQILKIHEEIMYALVSRRIHNEVGAILRANPRLWHENNSFYMWMAEIYEDSILMLRAQRTPRQSWKFTRFSTASTNCGPSTCTCCGGKDMQSHP